MVLGKIDKVLNEKFFKIGSPSGLLTLLVLELSPENSGSK